MFKKTLLALTLLMAIALVQCKSKEAVSTSNETETAITTDTETETPEVKTIVIDRDHRFTETDAFIIQSLSINEDLLTVKVTYSGGCEEHGFTMYSNEMIKKSLPPKHTLFLEHESNDDNCRALITQDLIFKLDNVQLGGSGTVIFNINNHKESIAYSYEKEQQD